MVNAWFFDGQNVVSCVVNVVVRQALFWLRKMRQVFTFISMVVTGYDIYQRFDQTTHLFPTFNPSQTS
jgi:hypothetical protein